MLSILDFLDDYDNKSVDWSKIKVKRFGIGYQGSKNGIVKPLIDFLPKAEIFVDVFAGGCAMTHGAMVSGKYKSFIANDIKNTPLLFKSAIYGEFSEERAWVSREEFREAQKRLGRSDIALIDMDRVRDMYIALCWSFGNAGKEYMYSKEIEPYKRAYHYALVLDDWKPLNEFAPYIEKDCREAMSKCDDTASRRSIVRRWIGKEGNFDRLKQDYIAWYKKEVLHYNEDIERAKTEHYMAEEELKAYIRGALKQSGLRAVDIDRHLGTNGMAGHYFGDSQWEFPTYEVYEKLREILPLPYDYFTIVDKYKQSLERLESLERLQSLERLESLQSLERLESLQSLSVFDMDYRAFGDFIDVVCETRELKKSDVLLYCDPPYRNTIQYHGAGDFNHDIFYQWCQQKAKEGYKIYISEYSMPAPFKSVFNIEKRKMFSKSKDSEGNAVSLGNAIEHLYTL